MAITVVKHDGRELIWKALRNKYFWALYGCVFKLNTLNILSQISYSLVIFLISVQHIIWQILDYLVQLRLRGEPQSIYSVGSWIRPLAKLLRRLRESHIGCNCAVDNCLEDGKKEHLVI